MCSSAKHAVVYFPQILGRRFNDDDLFNQSERLTVDDPCQPTGGVIFTLTVKAPEICHSIFLHFDFLHIRYS